MTTIEGADMERRLSAAFHGGERTTRELRLSAEEASGLRARYPAATLTALPGDGSGKSWFNVEFNGGMAT